MGLQAPKKTNTRILFMYNVSVPIPDEVLYDAHLSKNRQKPMSDRLLPCSSIKNQVFLSVVVQG